MGLAWQRGPLSPRPTGRLFSGRDAAAGRLLFLEPLGRRMSVVLGGAEIAVSDDVVLLHEPARYPVAYFPREDVAAGVLRSHERVTAHADLGPTRWWTVRGGDEVTARRGAWEHTHPPAAAEALRDRVAFAWRAMDAFFEENERILGHAADPYHRIDIRASRRHLTVHSEGELLADTRAPLALYESGFATRWYVPREDIRGALLTLAEDGTFCPYKGVASYYDIGESRRAAWSYRSPFAEVARIAGLVSFEPDKVDVRLDGERLAPAPGQAVVAHGIDRDLTLDELGGVEITGSRSPSPRPRA